MGGSAPRRAPAVAGSFYPADPVRLRRAVRECVSHRHGPGTRSADAAIGAVCPHAGYEYSGPVACHALAAIAAGRPDTVVVIGPDHVGLGEGASTAGPGGWETPLGTVPVDAAASAALAEAAGGLVREDAAPHAREHSIEVVLPMLQEFIPGGFSVLPVLVSDQRRGAAERLGRAVARVAASLPGSTAVVGSSDLTHYEPPERAREQDAALLEPAARMDAERFYSVLEGRGVTACGYGAMAAAMTACRLLGASSGTVLKYATSSDARGSGRDACVGYGAVAYS